MLVTPGSSSYVTVGSAEEFHTEGRNSRESTSVDSGDASQSGEQVPATGTQEGRQQHYEQPHLMTPDGVEIDWLEVTPPRSRKLGQPTAPIKVIVTHDSEIAIKYYKFPNLEDKPRRSPFLEAMTGYVVFQAEANQLRTENQELAERDEHKRKVDRERKARQRQKDPESARRRNREYMREWRAKKNQETRQPPGTKPSKTS